MGNKITLLLLVALITTLIYFIILLLTPLELTVRFKCNGGTMVEDIKVRESEKIEIEIITTKEGYIFDGWYIDKDFNNEWIFSKYIVEKDMLLHAKWIKVTSLNYKSN